MKLSSVLGTFALSTLEAYRAYAGPVDAMSPVARTLAPNSYCCLHLPNGNTIGLPVASTSEAAFDMGNKCIATITKGTHDCSTWTGTASCPAGVSPPGMITITTGPPCT
ncbi:hypothetical protein E4U26_002788 [Claviceps purpurea]|nr:hypothetical protein E4U26_002788 [Claviceps purpurea]